MENAPKQYKCGLNRDTIKYIAMVTMLLNHIASALLMPGTILYQFMESIGYFTAITMVYFLVEGYYYTHDRKRYFQRLFLFGVLSEIPYCLVLTHGTIIRFVGCNMMFTLCLCFLLIAAFDRLECLWQKICVFLSITFASLFCDWGLFAPIFTVLFYWAKGEKKRVKCAYGISFFLFFMFHFLRCIGNYYGAMEWSASVIFSLQNSLGILLSGFCIIYLYNGKRAERFQAFSKWFFYWFYPVHLLILGILRICWM